MLRIHHSSKPLSFGGRKIRRTLALETGKSGVQGSPAPLCSIYLDLNKLCNLSTLQTLHLLQKDYNFQRCREGLKDNVWSSQQSLWPRVSLRIIKIDVTMVLLLSSLHMFMPWVPTNTISNDYFHHYGHQEAF